MFTLSQRWLLVLIAFVIPLIVSGCLGPTGDPIADYPHKTVTVICPWASGGGTDMLSRFWAQALQTEFDNNPFVVTNRTGGGGVTGHKAGARARADGLTITMITFELSTLHHMGKTDLTHKDFQPLLQMNADPAAIIVGKDAPWKTLRDFLDDVKQNPGQIRMSGTAKGGAWDLARAGLLLADGQKVDAIRWISQQGAAPSLTQLLGGHIESVCCSVPEAKSHIESGQLRALAVMSNERLKAFPDIPTAKEAGLDWTAVGWRGLALPKGTPPQIVQRLEKKCQNIAKSSEFMEFMEKFNYRIEVRNPAEFRKFLQAQDEQWRKVVQAVGYAK